MSTGIQLKEEKIEFVGSDCQILYYCRQSHSPTYRQN